MGAWGHQFDEDDSALDWLGTFEDNMNWSTVEAAFMAVKEADYVEYDECCGALVAGEIVASALGQPNTRLSGAIRSWAEAHSLGAVPLQHIAHEAVARVRGNSELSELWSESESAAAWNATVDDLILRLK